MLMAAGLIVIHVFTAYGVDEPDGELNWWDKTVMGVPDWKFNDLFGLKNPGKDMYKAVLQKVLTSPRDKAMDAMASKYGITKEQVEAMVEGSTLATTELGSFVSNMEQFADKNNSSMSYRDELQMTKMIQDDFANFQNLFQMQEDVEMDTGIREIFANNDLADSGFDLISDLSLIEYIIFNDFTEPTIGAPFPGAPTSPVPEGSGGGGNKNNNGGGGGGNGDGDDDTEGDDTGGDDTGDDDGGSGSGGGLTVKNGIANIPLGGGNSVKAEVLSADECNTIENPTEKALSKYDEGTGNGNGGDGDDTGGDDTGDDDNGGGSGGDDNNGGGGDDTGDDDTGDDGGGNGGGSGGQIPDVPADSWGSTFCPPLNGDDPSENPIDPSTIPSFGGTPGAAVTYESQGFSVSASICFSLEFITGGVAVSKDLNSIKGEVDKINQTFDEFLNKSLVPNKVTGNMLEPAKCSKSLSALMPEIKFIAYSAPVLTPPNDDMILESNIFAKFNNMLESNGWTPVNEKFEEQFNVKYPATDLDQQQFIQNVQDYMAMATGDEKAKAEGEELGANIHAKMVIADTLLPEMEMMASYFEGFKQLYDNIYYGPCTSGTGGNTPLMGKEKE